MPLRLPSLSLVLGLATRWLWEDTKLDEWSTGIRDRGVNVTPAMRKDLEEKRGALLSFGYAADDARKRMVQEQRR